MRKSTLAIPLILIAGLIGFSSPALAGGQTRVYVNINDVYFDQGRPYYGDGGSLLSVAYYYGQPRYYHHGYRDGYAPRHSYYRGGYGHSSYRGYRSSGHRDRGHGGHGYRSHGHGGHGYRSSGHGGHGYRSSGHRSHGSSGHGRGHR